MLVGAVWLGMSAAASLAQPIARLVQAAGRVAAGDLAARVEIGRDPEEIAVLSRAFNRMTFDLGRQQEALRDAHVDAESRRAFTEAVLLGVSAGVIGLDSQGTGVGDQPPGRSAAGAARRGQASAGAWRRSPRNWLRWPTARRCRRRGS